MTKEALKLALEALEEAADAIDSWGSYASEYFQVKHDLENDISKAKSAITAIKEALAAPVQEPAVWVRTNGINNSGVAYYGPTCPPSWVGAATAYFKAPSPEPAQKPMHPELKKLYEDFFDKCFKETFDLALDTTPPQRTWVGLTDEEIEQGCKESWVTEQAFQSAVWWAEAKLKERNT